jgi:hypothetical protein
MRFVVAKRHGGRGSGLGNEILPWAKGWIASQVLDAPLVGPSWGLNQRKYWRNFGTSRLDFLCEDALTHLPHHAFTESEYRATGEIDFGAAIQKWAATRVLTKRLSFIVRVEGMWGGYPSIHKAREFLLSKLSGSRDALRNAYQVESKLDRRKLFVAVHMRYARDGFSAVQPGEDVRGRFNIFIPGEWYLWVCGELKKQFGDHIQFWFFTDRRGPEFDEAVRRFNPGQLQQQGLTECSDLLLMTRADLRVCSVSSYSLAASFLSGGPYLWYEPQLSLDHGMYSLWGHIGPQHAPRTPEGNEFGAKYAGGGNHQALAPGTAMNVGDPIPESLLTILEQKLLLNDPRTNLLDYGYLPEAAIKTQAAFQ